MRKMPTFILAMALLIALAVWQWAVPADEFSEMENRVLAQKPTLSFENFWSGRYSEDLADFAADQIPLRDGFVATYAAMQAALGRREVSDALLGDDGFLFDTSAEYRSDYMLLNTGALTHLAELTGKEAYLLAVPSASAVYQEKVPEGALMNNEEQILREAYNQMQVIPLLDTMRASEEKLFYATDHHWTAAGARIGYEAVCEALKLTPLAPSEVVSVEGFYGSFYARYPLPWLEGDALTYEMPKGIRLLIEGEEQTKLTDEAVLQGRDKYAALLHGNHGRIELVNDSVEEGVLLVIKDSYANALLPVLAQHYHRIIAVDPRYFTGDITELTAQYEGEVILCVCGTSTLAASRIIYMMEGI